MSNRSIKPSIAFVVIGISVAIILVGLLTAGCDDSDPPSPTRITITPNYTPPVTTDCPPITAEPTRDPEPSTPITETAILFLIDESGGVSGECDEGGLFVVDEDGMRYTIADFFLVLLGAFPEERPELRNLMVGVVQFAEGPPNVVLPPTRASSLHRTDSWRQIHADLTARTLDLSGLDTCHTDFSSALNQATEILSETQMEEQFLVLITDGSFRGSPNADDPHSQTESALREILEAESSLSIYTLILGPGCPDSCDPPPVGISKAECNRRREDLWFWRHMDHSESSLTTRSIEHGSLVQNLSALPGIARFLPSGASWMDPSGRRRLNIHQYSQSLSVYAVYVEPHGEPRLQDSDGHMRPYSSYGIANVFEWFVSYPEPSREGTCETKEWILDTGPGHEVLYWMRESMPSFEIESIEVAGGEVVLNKPEASDHPTATVYVDLTGTTRDFSDLGNCYSLTISLLNEGVRSIATKTINLVGLDHPYRITDELALPTDLEEQSMTLNARIECPSYALNGALSEASVPVPALYEARLMGIEPLRRGDEVSIRVLIRYGGDRYVSEFNPDISIPECHPQPGVTPTAFSCFNPDNEEIPFTQGWLEEDVAVYTVTVPYNGVWEPGCGCRLIEVSWTGFEAICDAWETASPCVITTSTP